MGTLVLSEFKCYEETNEVGDDSPYFVFFVGKSSTPNTAQLVRIRQPHWDNDVSKGDLLKPGASVANVDGNTLVLCALIEEDVNADVGTGNNAFKKIRTHMRTVLQAFGVNGSTPGELAKKLIPEFEKAIKANTTNDDLIQIVHLPMNINLEQHGSFTFKGNKIEGGHYKA